MSKWRFRVYVRGEEDGTVTGRYGWDSIFGLHPLWGSATSKNVHSCSDREKKNEGTKTINSQALLQFLWLLEAPRILEYPGDNTVVYNTCWNATTPTNRNHTTQVSPLDPLLLPTMSSPQNSPDRPKSDLFKLQSLTGNPWGPDSAASPSFPCSDTTRTKR